MAYEITNSLLARNIITIDDAKNTEEKIAEIIPEKIYNQLYTIPREKPTIKSLDGFLIAESIWDNSMAPNLDPEKNHYNSLRNWMLRFTHPFSHEGSLLRRPSILREMSKIPGYSILFTQSYDPAQNPYTDVGKPLLIIPNSTGNTNLIAHIKEWENYRQEVNSGLKSIAQNS